MPVIPDPADFPSVTKKGDEQNKPEGERPKAAASDYMSKGPQIPEEMPPTASHEELEARMKELNKSKKD